jgi:hypothetical protein
LNHSHPENWLGWLKDVGISWDFELNLLTGNSCCVHRLHFRMISDDFRVLTALPLNFFEDWFLDDFTTIDTLVTTQCFDSWCWILSWSWLMYANANATLAKMSHQQSPPPKKKTIFTMEKDYIWPPQK